MRGSYSHGPSRGRVKTSAENDVSSRRPSPPRRARRDRPNISSHRSDLILINGCLCCNLSLYADCPECIGASCKGELLCCVQRFCFKFGVPPLTCCESFVDKEVCCQVGLCCCAIGVKCPSTRVAAQKHRPSVDSYPPARHRHDFDSTRRCIKHQGQCCCIVENVAIPCDSEIPMYRDGVRRWGLRPIGATVARQIPVLKVTRSNRVSVTVTTWPPSTVHPQVVRDLLPRVSPPRRRLRAPQVALALPPRRGRTSDGRGDGRKGRN